MNGYRIDSCCVFSQHRSTSSTVSGSEWSPAEPPCPSRCNSAPFLLLISFYLLPVRFVAFWRTLRRTHSKSFRKWARQAFCRKDSPGSLRCRSSSPSRSRPNGYELNTNWICPLWWIWKLCVDANAFNVNSLSISPTLRPRIVQRVQKRLFCPGNASNFTSNYKTY